LFFNEAGFLAVHYNLCSFRTKDFHFHPAAFGQWNFMQQISFYQLFKQKRNFTFIYRLKII
jgi:hypothetical protein